MNKKEKEHLSKVQSLGCLICENPETPESNCVGWSNPMLIANCTGIGECVPGMSVCYIYNDTNVTTSVTTVTETAVLREATDCNGCILDEACVNIGYRYAGQYCDLNGEFSDQKSMDAACENHFECENNLCLESQCVEGNLVFLQKFLTWLKSLFEAQI